MTKERIALGRLGENLAKKRLKKLGYKILDTNYRCPLGEIDLIALDGDAVVFVEIKTRKSQSLGQAKEAVNKRKQSQLSKSALFYIKSNNLWESKARFDVVAVRLCDGKQDIEIIRNAFELSY